MPITATVTSETITAAVSEAGIDVSVGGAVSPVNLPIASVTQSLAGESAETLVTPAGMHTARRGSGRAKFWELFNDFAMAASGLDAGTDGCAFFVDAIGTGSAATVGGTTLGDLAGRVGAGLLTLSTGSEATGRSGFDNGFNATTFRFDAGTTTYETLLYLPTLASSGDDYTLRIGICNSNGLTNDVVAFEYDRSNSVNWHGLTGYNATYTRVNSGVAVAAAKWIMLKIVWTHTSAEFFVNGVSVGTSSSNIRPDGGGRIGGHILKTAGTTSRSALIDYVYLRHDFSTDRTYTP